ncbi:hypothetical protein CCR71_19365 [Salmonella enterica]|nr:hypothetical protein [Salmonella enterica]EBS7181784.1 hypothetical protein [Salmonella enterica]EGM6570396.1 hypothetical protein [Salmonella enterica]
MTFLFNVIFRILHMLMVLMPSQNSFKIWLRQMAEDALLMAHVAADIRLAGELFRLKSRYSGGDIASAELIAERILHSAAYRLGGAVFHGLSSRWPVWVIYELERRGSFIEEGVWGEGRSYGYRDACDYDI